MTNHNHASHLASLVRSSRSTLARTAGHVWTNVSAIAPILNRCRANVPRFRVSPLHLKVAHVISGLLRRSGTSGRVASRGCYISRELNLEINRRSCWLPSGRELYIDPTGSLCFTWRLVLWQLEPFRSEDMIYRHCLRF